MALLVVNRIFTKILTPMTGADDHCGNGFIAVVCHYQGNSLFVIVSLYAAIIAGRDDYVFTGGVFQQFLSLTCWSALTLLRILTMKLGDSPFSSRATKFDALLDWRR